MSQRSYTNGGVGQIRGKRAKSGPERETGHGAGRAAGARAVASARVCWTFLRYAGTRFFEDRCPSSAAALTYAALLALVPLMTISLAILSAFPAFASLRDMAEDFVFQTLVPQVGSVVLNHLQAFATNTGQLTAVGVVGLVITALLLLATIEAAFNNIWRVREDRPLLIRLLSFWAVLTLTPLLFAAGLSLTIELVDRTGARPTLATFIGLLPLAFEFVGFLLIYQIIPNRDVRWADSAVGALVAAVLFELSKTIFAAYLTAFPIYQTIYGAVSTIPIFLVWVYVAWSIVLLGAVVAAALPEWRAGRKVGVHLDKLLPGPRLTIAVAVLRELAAARRLGVGVTGRTLARRVPVGLTLIEGILAQLRAARFVERTGGGTWLLSRDLTTATVLDLLRGLGIGMRGPIGGLDALGGDWQGRLAALMEQAGVAQGEILGAPLWDILDLPGVLDGPSGPMRLESRRQGSAAVGEHS